MHVFRHRPNAPSPPAKPGAAFHQRLQDLLRQLNIPVAPGPAADAYVLRFAEEPSLYVMSAASGTVLFAACEAGVLPPASPAAMLSGLLALNHRPSCDTDVNVGLDTGSGTVVVSSRCRLTAVDAALFKSVLDAIRSTASAARAIISGASVSGTRRPAPR
ncbi:CesT family type III secretion system chaperone [Noviherbaspirillum aerium]|uniref:CesT family type III secretion system chaperone n=1 Tax=Noviherbaspirillum aerium TaxID=2588497 RepID=UPI001CEF8256|nr:CesT family type III secretion system chaperone [Noviherbaspirillum aerium]